LNKKEEEVILSQICCGSHSGPAQLAGKI